MVRTGQKCTYALLVVGVTVAATIAHGAARAQSTINDGNLSHVVQDFSQVFRSAVERSQQSVVAIETQGGPRELIAWTMRESSQENGNRPDVSDPTSVGAISARMADGSGSGIIFDSRGYIVTCHHVVEFSDTVFVRLSDGRRLEVETVWSDPFTDIAVLQIDAAEGIAAATWGDSDELQVGDWVVTIGNPYSLGMSASAGIVSATDRRIPAVSHVRLIQTDAASNPGNSGGAIVNLDGQVVGISEGGYGVHEGFQGIGFAIPINAAKRIAQQLIDSGRVTRVALDCTTEQLSSKVAKHLGIPKDAGLIVTDLAENSPAAEAGLQVADVITHFNGNPICSNSQFLEMLERSVPGGNIKLTILRGTASDEVVIHTTEPTVLRRDQASRFPRVDKEPSGYHDEKIGLAVDDISPHVARTLGYELPINGLVITYVRPQSPIAKEDVCAGMILFRIDGQPMTSIEQFRRMTNQKSLDEGIMLLIGSPRRKHFVVYRSPGDDAG